MTNMDCKLLLAVILLATRGCKTGRNRICYKTRAYAKHGRPIIYEWSLKNVAYVGELIEKPRDTEVKVNDSTYFNCSTDYGSTAIFWFHGNKFVYTGTVILQPYHERFVIDRNVFNGTYIFNLVIHSVHPDDAGKYTCEEDEGAGEKSSAQLVVLENDPECQSNVRPDGVIGQNIFNIPQDDIQLTCNATFYGSEPPQIEWMTIQDGRSIKTNFTSTVISKNRIISTLKMKGDISLDKSSYVCQTARSIMNQYNCTSDIVKVLYFVDGNTTEQNVVIGDTITCISSNSTFPCTSQWYHDNYTCPLSCDETITAHLLGTYLCTVKCHVRGRDYYFDTLKAFVAEPTQSPFPSTAESTLLIVYVLVAVVVTLAVIGALVFVLYWRRVKKVAEEERRLLDELTAINGIAVLGEEVFIARERYTNIAVYDSKSFLFKRNITVKGMISAEPIVSCSVNKCLYTFVWSFKAEFTNVILGINDPAKDENNVILTALIPYNAMLRIDPSNGNLDKEWKVVEGGGRLSVADDTNVILNINFQAKLHEYTADGEFIRVIDFREGTGIHVLRVWQAVKRHDGMFVICQGCEGDPVNRVCLLSTVATEKTHGTVRIDGVNFEKDFGRADGEQRLHYPMYLSRNKEESILVSDINLLLLSSDLRRSKILIGGGKTAGWRTCFDESTRQWLVTGGKRIVVFQVENEEVIKQSYERRLGLLDWVLTSLQLTPARHGPEIL